MISYQSSIFPLWDNDPPFGRGEVLKMPTFEVFLPTCHDKDGAVIVIHGGGYAFSAEHEGAPVAKRFAQEGITAFVLNYRFSPSVHPAPLADLYRALRLIRSKAHIFGIDPTKIALAGFSAGGHLAACAATLFEQYTFNKEDSLSDIPNRPDALILSYPVISSGEFAHHGSFEALLGHHNSADLRKELSLEHRVNKNTPPTFIWHTADDSTVPVENSLLFANALWKANVDCSLHVFPKGTHGLGLANEDPYVSCWFEMARKWLGVRGY